MDGKPAPFITRSYGWLRSALRAGSRASQAGSGVRDRFDLYSPPTGAKTRETCCLAVASAPTPAYEPVDVVLPRASASVSDREAHCQLLTRPSVRALAGA
jgi:hypothetical protein